MVCNNPFRSGFVRCAWPETDYPKSVIRGRRFYFVQEWVYVQCYARYNYQVKYRKASYSIIALLIILT